MEGEKEQCQLPARKRPERPPPVDPEDALAFSLLRPKARPNPGGRTRLGVG